MQFELLRAYIEFSYPRMPVIHLEAFCQAIESCDGSGGKISIMLYQAVLFAGAAHVRSSVAEENGWASKKTLRRELHQRVEVNVAVIYGNHSKANSCAIATLRIAARR